MPVHGTHTAATAEGEVPVKAIARRLRRLEHRFGMTEPQPRPEFVIEFISPVDKSVVSRLYMGGDRPPPVGPSETR